MDIIQHAYISQEADMGYGPLLMSLERSEGVDFGDTLMFFNFKVMSGRGSPEMNPWGFLYPLTPMVWLGLFAALVCVWLSSVLLLNHALRSSWFDRVVGQFTIHIRVLLRQGRCPCGILHYVTRGKEKGRARLAFLYKRGDLFFCSQLEQKSIIKKKHMLM